MFWSRGHQSEALSTDIFPPIIKMFIFHDNFIQALYLSYQVLSLFSLYRFYWRVDCLYAVQMSRCYRFNNDVHLLQNKNIICVRVYSRGILLW